MKNFTSANRYLSVALALAAIVAAGTLPASAQSRDHTGSMMPFYYDGEGGQKTGAWAAEEKAEAANKTATANKAAAANKTATANKAGTANKQAAQPGRSLYLFAGKRSPHQDVQVH
jgi:hypothetical protein